MIWLILAIILVLVVVGLFFFLKNLKKTDSTEAKKVVRWSIGMAVGGIVGAVTGIALVEFGGYSYPLAAVSWMVGMAAGQVGGILYSKYRT